LLLYVIMDEPAGGLLDRVNTLLGCYSRRLGPCPRVTVKPVAVSTPSLQCLQLVSATAHNVA